MDPTLSGAINLFAVACLVTWPFNESEAGVDLVVIQTNIFSYANGVVVILISKNVHKKSREVSIKAKSTPASPSFIGQVTKHITVKWTFETKV